jgi:hypothetical protein
MLYKSAQRRNGLRGQELPVWEWEEEPALPPMMERRLAQSSSFLTQQKVVKFLVLLRLHAQITSSRLSADWRQDAII